MIKRLHLLFSFLLLFSFFAGAAERYWVGGTGDWKETKHWSTISGGKGGASVPYEMDEVIFDASSFTSVKEYVTINSDIELSHITFLNLKFDPAFYVGFNVSITFNVSKIPDLTWKKTFCNYLHSSNDIDSFQFARESNSNGGQNNSSKIKSPTIQITSCVAVVTVPISCPANATNNNSTVPPLNCNGQATVSPLPFPGPYNYIWSCGNQTTQTATGLCSGPCTGFVIDTIAGDSCPFSIFVNGLNNFNPSFNKVKPLCFGQCNGSIQLNLAGGTAPFSYSWAPTAQTTQTATGLCAGNYTCFIIDANGCMYTTPTTVLTQPTALAVVSVHTNEPCFGNCVATATATVSGGTLPYSYSWSCIPTQSTVTATGLCAGTYTCFITDGNGCTLQPVYVITQPLLLTAATSQFNVQCNGVCIGTATVTPSGGTSPYTYLWNPTGQTTQTATGLCAGNYSCTVTDANGCTVLKTFIITQPTTLSTATSSTNNPLNCNDVCNATATATPSGGTPAYTYLWTPGNFTTQSISNLCAGSYVVTVTDAHGCTTQQTVIITQPPPVTGVISTTNNPLNCFGNCNATATVTPGGGVPAYTYLWNPGNQTTQSISNLCAGTYSCTVTDSHGCTVQVTVTITQPTVIVPNVTTTNNPLLCNGNCNATATANPSGGTPGYTYLWTPGNFTTQTINGLCAGSYTVVVTDSHGCNRQQIITITQPTILTLTLNATSLACNGNCNATVSSSSGGGTAPYTYLWSPGNQTTASITGQCAGTYSCTITDAHGCTVLQTITVTQPTALSLVVASNPVVCNGQCNGSASAIGGGGTPAYTYLWSPGGQTTSTITGQCAGNYSVTITDANGCTLQQTVVITQPTQVVVNASATNVTCNGNCDGTATANPSGGTPPYTYSWTPGNFTTQSISNLCPGIYICTVTDANGCPRSQNVTITQPQILNAVITSGTSSCNVCNGTSTVTGSGGTGPYTYSWNTIPVQTTQTATGLCPTNYTVTITDANGCTAQVQATVLQVVVIQITTSGSTLPCTGNCVGIATANAAGGQSPYSYLWTFPVQTTQSATGLCAGTYTVHATDANGCTGIDSITFTDPPLLISSAVHTNLACNNICNGTASASAVGGTGAYTYSWAPGGQLTQNINGLCAGSYTVTVTDANGCTDTTAVTITQATPMVVNPVVTNANCLQCDGGINITPSGGTPGYTFNWMPGNLNTQNITNLCSGIYTLTITDANGCVQTFNIPVGNITGPTVTTVQTNVTCNGQCNGTATASVVGLNPPYTYLWTPSNQTNALATGLCAGVYSVKVTDAVGCITIVQVTITQPLLISPNATVVNSLCAAGCNGSITLATSGGTGPYTYLWNPGNATTSNITGLCAGVYQVTITDANLCDTTVSFTITAPTVLNVTIVGVNMNCNVGCTGSATATPIGGTAPYSYVWSNAGIVAQIVNLCQGTYTVTVTDANGCTDTASITITQPPPITIVQNSTNASCNGTCDGTASVVASGGTPPFTYLWTPGNMTTAAVNNLCNGAYNCTVTDANGCNTTLIFNINQPAAIQPNVVQTNSSCNNSCNGTATSNATGGAGGPYSYLWQPGALTGQTVLGLCAQSYTVTVTDINGCTGQQIFIITEPAPLLPNVGVVIAPTCPNSCDGKLISNPVGGTPPYTYLWTPTNQTTQIATGLCQNSYLVTVTDANGCTGQQNFLMADPPALIVNPAVAQANCGSSNGSITANPSGGTGPYTYLWSPGNATTGTITGLPAGLYTVVITDSHGCTATFTIPLSNTTGPILTMSSTPVSCNGVCDGTSTVVASGNGPFIYSWFSSGCSTPSCNNECAGSYTVQVTDAGGCITLDTVAVLGPAVISDHAIIVNAQCIGICNGSITLTPTGANGGPFTYLWSNAATTSSINGLCVGAYSVTITDAVGCTNVFNYNIIANTVVSVTASATSVSCNGTCDGTGTVTNVSGGTPAYTYLWNDPSGQFAITATGLCAGNYNVVVTDANGCQASTPITITQPTPITATFVNTQPSCGLNNGVITATPSGGTGPYTYMWNTGATTNSINGLPAGLYSAIITDANGCTTLINIPLSNSTAPTVVVTSTSPPCFGSPCSGTATATPSGGTPPYTYNWIPGNMTTASVNGLCGGLYFVQVQDAAGCIRTDSVVITTPTQILSNQVVINTDCGICNGSITANPSGGTGPYTYLWSPGNLTTAGITGLCAGIYTVVITDAVGCTQQYIIPITNINAPTVVVTTTNITCNGTCNGTASTAVVGGTSPYTYLWSNAATTPAVGGLCAGSYWVKVTDAGGCTTTQLFNILSPTPIVFSIANAIDPLCNGVCNGSISVIANGGTLPFTFLWNNLATTSSINNLCAGSYTCTVTDANGCTAQQIIVLTNPPSITQSGVVTPSSCNTVADGAINLTVNGGTSPYIYAWAPNGATTQDLTNVLSGSYTVTITDANGCSDTAQFVISANSTVIATIQGGNSICVGGCTLLTGTTSVNVSTYSWFAIPSMTLLGTNDSVVVCPIASGPNSYILIGANGLCTDTDTIIVTVNPLPNANAGPDVTILVGSSTPVGGSPTGPNGSTYSWYPAMGLNDSILANPIANPTATTTYYVQVTDANGCTSIDSMIVTVIPDIIFPNGITPNGDGANDYWIIDNIVQFPDNVVEVYNRWGELLYQGKHYDNSTVKWDGTYKGKPLPVGTYYYIIKLNTDLLDPDYFTGPITLMR